MKLDVVGFGALNIDKLYQVNRIAHEDEEAYITGFSESCRLRSAANTIIGLARLGVKTGFIGKVATDREGSLLHNNLQNENVNTKGVMLSDNGRSGTVSGFVDGKGQRALYVDPGVNDYVEEIDMDYINNTEVLHLTSFVGKYDEKSIKSQKNVLEELSTDVSMSLDPGRLYTDRGIQFLDKFLMRTDILLINRSELKHLLTGKIENSRSNNEDLKQETVKTAGKIQDEYGIDIVVVKLGDQGSYVTRNDESHITQSLQGFMCRYNRCR